MTIAQAPNLPLIVFSVAFVLRLVLDPSGDLRVGIDVIGLAALTIWAVDEIARGVNPFRRLLGGLVLGGVIAGLLS